MADGVPGDAANLAVTAAQTLAAEAGMAEVGAAIEIDKRIPVAAGLGGGSADAAAVLHALDILWHVGLDAEGLRAVGAKVGSDVPAMLAAEPVFATGRGEVLTPVHALHSWWVLKPFDFEVRTPDAFSWWDEDPVTGPRLGRAGRRRGDRQPRPAGERAVQRPAGPPSSPVIRRSRGRSSGSRRPARWAP